MARGVLTAAPADLGGAALGRGGSLRRAAAAEGRTRREKRSGDAGGAWDPLLPRGRGYPLEVRTVRDGEGAAAGQ